MNLAFAVLLFCCGVHFLAAFAPSSLVFGQRRGSKMGLKVDIFGIGPTELVVIAAAAAVLYGPGRLKTQLREKGVKNTAVSEGFKAEREERISLMLESAKRVRKDRSWKRISAGLEAKDQKLLEKLNEYEASVGDNA